MIFLSPPIPLSHKTKLQRIIMHLSLCHYLLAMSSPNRRGCLCRLSDGTHHQLYESPLFLIHQIWQHSGTDRGRTVWWLSLHNAGTAREQHELYKIIMVYWCEAELYALTQIRLLVLCAVLSRSSPASCSRNAVIVSQSLSSDPATLHRLSTRYAPCSWNCQES